MPADPKEYALAVRDGVSVFFGPSGTETPTPPVDVFAAPVASDEDLIARGLLDEKLEATSRGELFLDLQDAGIFDGKGVLTDKGRGYSMDERDLDKPENWQSFKTLWDDEVIRQGASPSEILKGTVDFGGQVLKGAGLMAYYGLKPWNVEEDKEKQAALGVSILDGLPENAGQWAGMAKMGAAWLGDKLGNPGEEYNEEGLWKARQEQWKLQKDIESMKAGELAEHVMGIEGMVEEAEQTRAALGDEEFENVYGSGKAFVSVALDPVNLVPGTFAVKGATMAPLATRWGLRAQQTIGRAALKDAQIAAMRTTIAAGETVLKKEASLGPRFSQVAANMSARGATEGAEKASTIATRIAQDAAKVREALPTLTKQLEAAQKQDDDNG